nr:UvrD-like helicase, ATP-binding domain, P-loop containing nucleoside triphosphate hydrolase [Tanacetum cinerariifolium]
MLEKSMYDSWASRMHIFIKRKKHEADSAGCPTTHRSTYGYCVFLGNNHLSWSSKRQFTISRFSAKAEYRGVANAVAETCWLRLHTPLSTSTLVYCDNVKMEKGVVAEHHEDEFTNLIFSWSLDDILNQDLFKNKVKEKCNVCSFGYDGMVSQKLDPHLLPNLNESHRKAIMAQRTLTYAPTNVAIVQLASSVLSLVKESYETTTAIYDYFSSVGDVLLFGNREILKVGTDTEEIYLEHRMERLAECLGPVTGLKDCIRYMIDLLQNYVSGYYSFIENEFLKGKQNGDENDESTIPLQLLGMKHAILVGDERQLPAMINSKVCIEYGFRRSLFGRLSSLGHSKHLLNVQYRMHPSISFFPNLKFYKNKVLDAQNVLSKSYEKVIKEEAQHQCYISLCCPSSFDSKQLAHKFENLGGFSVKVKSVDGFQGGEE